MVNDSYSNAKLQIAVSVIQSFSNIFMNLSHSQELQKFKYPMYQYSSSWQLLQFLSVHDHEGQDL